MFPKQKNINKSRQTIQNLTQDCKFFIKFFKNIRYI